MQVLYVCTIVDTVNYLSSQQHVLDLSPSTIIVDDQVYL